MIPEWLPQHKELYLFDVDGVIIDAPERFSTGYEREIGEPGVMVPFFAGVFQDCLIGKADLREEVEKHLAEWKWSGDVDSFLERWFTSESQIHQETYNAVAALHEQGKPCYLVTNQEKYRTAFLAKLLDADTFVDGIFSSSDVGFKKPQKEFYEAVLKRVSYNGDMHNVFYVDDDPKNVAAAQDLGIDSFYYSVRA